jgi:alpha-tubulin suppressor-like RCC1 family protein
MYSWGWNEHGNLGTGDLTDRLKPTTLILDQEDGSKVKEVFCGGAFVIVKLINS